jgi:hypothetical protein
MSLMTDAFKRGNARGRARSEDQRPDSFKKGHKKRGGRQRGTPNIFSAQYKKDILEAAYRVGEDANGKLGIVGYLQWVAVHHPNAFCPLLGGVMESQELKIETPEKPRSTMEELDQEVRAYIGLSSDDLTPPEPAEPAPTASNKDRTPRQTKRAQPKRSNSKPRMQTQTQPPDPESPWAWTGKDTPVGPLMHLAVTDPIEFCTLFQAAFLPRPTAWQRGCAEQRAWEESLRVEEREQVRKKEQDLGPS